MCKTENKIVNFEIWIRRKSVSCLFTWNPETFHWCGLGVFVHVIGLLGFVCVLGWDGVFVEQVLFAHHGEEVVSLLLRRDVQCGRGEHVRGMVAQLRGQPDRGTVLRELPVLQPAIRAVVKRTFSCILPNWSHTWIPCVVLCCQKTGGFVLFFKCWNQNVLPAPVEKWRRWKGRMHLDRRPAVVLEPEFRAVPAVLVAPRSALMLHRCKTRKR